MSKRYEVTLDLSLSTKEEADNVALILLRNGYSIYFSYDSFEDNCEPPKQELCITMSDEEVTEIHGK